MTNNTTPEEAQKNAATLRSAIWNNLGHDQKLGRALTTFGMSRFNLLVDQLIFEHTRPASQGQAVTDAMVKTAIRDFNGGLVKIADDSKKRGYVVFYGPEEAMRTTLINFLTALRSQSGLVEAVKPFEDCAGDLPEWDDPLRCVYESGIQYAVDLLAKTLGIKHYSPCDGTEDFDGDLGGTMFNIVLEAMPKDADGDPIHPKDVCAALSTIQESRNV